MHDNPNIIGGERVAWSALIVCGCILAYGLVVLLTSFPSGPAPADPTWAPGFLKG